MTDRSSLRAALGTIDLYGRASLDVLRRRGRQPAEERLVFVIGSPRSGTTFFAGALGSQPGFVDLGELRPLKAAIPDLVARPREEAAATIRTIVERVRRLGFARHLRGVEQTPETAYVVEAALAAYPQARAIHLVRDGRDVVCSLLERGWLSRERDGRDDARLPFGAQPRFWLADDERERFAELSDAGRCASAWRHYVIAARAAGDRALEVRYEDLVGDRAATAARVASHLGLDEATLGTTLETARDDSVGRWRRDLTPEQLADVEAEAGELLAELGYV